ncbi:MAG: electron transport complex subunit RsxC [Chitinispirillaceae bacterium]|nr:electron transport complex subunit RsxC [Chitinispirillaceae bacterium]
MAFASFTFKGGIHPPTYKGMTNKKPIEPAAVPARLFVPLLQHIGAPAAPAVEAGQEVKKGQIIGTTGGFVSAPIHAPASGKVAALATVSHPAGMTVPAVIIDNDSAETWCDLAGMADYSGLSREDLCERIHNAGIVGMGGATFPTRVKLSPVPGCSIDTLIINGVECEPYLTSDHRLMLEKSGEIVEGARIIAQALGVSRCMIGIEANKPDAIALLTKACGNDPLLSVHSLKVKYPQGAEKMLIKALAGREVAPRALPSSVGVVVQNVATAAAVYQAVRYGRPLIERVVTVTGDAVNEPKNLLVRIGTTVGDLIAQCGGFKGEPGRIVMGGPMMGFALSSADYPVTKGTSGILVLSKGSLSAIDDFGPCIRCGRCIDACPMGLMPSILGILSEKGNYEETRSYNLHDCFECGSCTYVCPAKRPMVQFIKLAKSLVKP